MNAKHLVAIALATAALVAACGDDGGQQLIGQPDDNGSARVPGSGTGGGTGGGAGGGAQEQGVPSSAPAQTNSAAGKDYFVKTLHPALMAACGACHNSAGPGPKWIDANVEISYKLQFQLGYVATSSRIVLKGPHSTTPGLAGADVTKFTTWVNLELKDGGQQAPPNVLDKISRCINRQTFDAMQLQDMRTTQRTTNNNTNNVTPWNENANNCTGCNNAPCRTCHAGDDATGFVTAQGNPNLPADFSFNETKKTNPAYLQKYFGVSPTGEPIASNAILLKATATQKDKAYTHPMFTVSTQMQQRISAFVDKAIADYKANACPP